MKWLAADIYVLRYFINLQGTPQLAFPYYGQLLR
jgi:hypothetical protein